MKNTSIVTLCLIALFIMTGCADKETLNEIQNTQKEILAKVTNLEKQISAFSPRKRPTVDYNKVYTLPVAHSPVKGNKDVPVTIVEFSDFQCPYCSRIQPTLRQVLKAYPKEVNLVFKHYPLSFHKQARNAVKAALAAEEQGKFWEMHDVIFENFSTLSEDKFEEFAVQLALNVEKFKEDYGSTKYDKIIQQDTSLARSVGITGTPTLFLNGKRMRGRSFGDFKTSIDNILKK